MILEAITYTMVNGARLSLAGLCEVGNVRNPFIINKTIWSQNLPKLLGVCQRKQTLCAC